MTISSLPLASTRIMAPSPHRRQDPGSAVDLLGWRLSCSGLARRACTQHNGRAASEPEAKAGHAGGEGRVRRVGDGYRGRRLGGGGAKQPRWPLPPSVPPQVIDTSTPLKAAAANDRVDGDGDGDGDGDASIPGSGAAVRTHPLAPDAHVRPGRRRSAQRLALDSVRDAVCAVRTLSRLCNRLTSTFVGSPALFWVALRAAQRW
jgi:hypothetical protein